MPRLRPFRAGDEAALAEICLRTADDGADATGVLPDDDLWAALFVLPYVARHPDLALVVETDDGRVAGYIVGTPDTDAFEEWFARDWWPQVAPHRRPRGEAEGRYADLLDYAAARGTSAHAYARDHPAHLHIDLLPEVQGRGWGRRLVAEFVQALRDRGVSGVHLVASAGNTGALAFYPRLGFVALPSGPGERAFGMSLD
ncbi:ribosomal protein S18 acetylase RimI-like enzyme [Microbacterium sp. AK009]|uniref:GNAT family N-acetyltransferase n=1 Tax=Microbacterium sp. AK009 TaxID=2723068 RepID=UPI0015CBED5E|nr:GNAT family N-acetyltransferase [Microbacterium sp. AK009]NYF17680.1 ribosomal protein S18 acetylase RimI-like enzyme [Microbacterium sp. AK009]